MRAINLYYKDIKINNRPLSNEEVDKILENEYIYKRNNYGKLIKIPSNKIMKINTIII